MKISISLQISSRGLTLTASFTPGFSEEILHHPGFWDPSQFFSDDLEKKKKPLLDLNWWNIHFFPEASGQCQRFSHYLAMPVSTFLIFWSAEILGFEIQIVYTGATRLYLQLIYYLNWPWFSWKLPDLPSGYSGVNDCVQIWGSPSDNH